MQGYLYIMTNLGVWEKFRELSARTQNSKLVENIATKMFDRPSLYGPQTSWMP